MSILQKIADLGFDEKRIKLDEAVFNSKKDELVLHFMYPEDKTISVDEKKSILDVISNDIGDLCKVTVKFNKSCFDEEVIYERIEEYIEKYYKALKNELSRDDITIRQLSGDEPGAEIIISCDEMRKQVFVNKNFDTDLKAFLLRKFFFDFVITLCVDCFLHSKYV